MGLVNANKRLPAIVVTILAGLNVLFPDSFVGEFWSLGSGFVSVGTVVGVMLFVVAFWLWRTEI